MDWSPGSVKSISESSFTVSAITHSLSFSRMLYWSLKKFEKGHRNALALESLPQTELTPAVVCPAVAALTLPNCPTNKSSPPYFSGSTEQTSHFKSQLNSLNSILDWKVDVLVWFGVFWVFVLVVFVIDYHQLHASWVWRLGNHGIWEAATRQASSNLFNKLQSASVPKADSWSEGGSRQRGRILGAEVWWNGNRAQNYSTIHLTLQLSHVSDAQEENLFHLKTNCDYWNLGRGGLEKFRIISKRNSIVWRYSRFLRNRHIGLIVPVNRVHSLSQKALWQHFHNFCDW